MCIPGNTRICTCAYLNRLLNKHKVQTRILCEMWTTIFFHKRDYGLGHEIKHNIRIEVNDAGPLYNAPSIWQRVLGRRGDVKRARERNIVLTRNVENVVDKARGNNEVLRLLGTRTKELQTIT